MEYFAHKTTQSFSSISYTEKNLTAFSFKSSVLVQSAGMR